MFCLIFINFYNYRLSTNFLRILQQPRFQPAILEYTLDNSANIDFVFWDRTNYFVPSGCSLSYFVSNNNGTTWESYAGTETGEHNFSSVGDILRIKMVASGDPSKNAYKMGDTKDVILFGTKYSAEMDPAIRQKMTKFKLRGKKK